MSDNASDTLWTFEAVMTRLLNNVPNTVDKREGSVIYDALAPCARELVNMYNEVQTALDNTFAGTADREWLIKRCAEIGVVPLEATYAVRRGVFTPSTLEISIGERFSFENVNFTVTEKLEEDGEYALTCEEAGEVGNDGSGTLIPVQYIQGLESATLMPDVIIYGEEEESTEDLRQRYFDTLPTMTLDGNIAQYSKWCREFAGIGNYKIFPEWNGKNTVKVSILSSENTAASQQLIDDFQEYLDPKASEEATSGEGLGMGQAPIGAIVTVATAEVVKVNIDAVLQLKTGFNEPVGLEDELNEYLRSLNYERTTVPYVGITAIFANNYTVDLPLSVTVNGAQQNLELTEEQIVELGTLHVEVA